MLRTTLLRLTLIGALLSLTGCVFAVGDTRDWEEWDDDCDQCEEMHEWVEHLEQRVEHLEEMHAGGADAGH